MSADIQQLLTDALELPLGDRARLAALLIESLNPESETEADPAWSDEIRRRLEDIDAGRVRMVPWAEARRIIRGEDDAVIP